MIKDRRKEMVQEQKVNLEDMTIQELYDWAKDHSMLDYKIRIQYRDEAGEYFGYDKEVLLDVDEKNKAVLL